MLHTKNKYFAISESAVRLAAVAFSMCCYIPVILAFVTSSFAQESQLLFSQPRGQLSDALQFGVDKIANTFVFIGNADIEVPVFEGTFRLSNVYRGSAFRTLNTAIRDDEALFSEFSYPISEPLSTFFRQTWLVSRDSRSLGLSSLQRIGGAVGMKYAPDQDFWSEAFGGLEQTTQLGVISTGPLLSGQAVLNHADLEQWDMSGKVFADWHKMDALRINTDFDVDARASRTIADGSRFSISGNYGALERAYFTTISGTQNQLAVEARNENRVSFSGNLDYVLSPLFSVRGLGSVQSNRIGRLYKEDIQTATITAVNRELGELLLDFEGSVTYTSLSTSLMTGASVYRRNEQNSVSQVYNITPTDFAQIRAQEFQRDNNTVRTRFLARAEHRFSEHDTLQAEWSWWLLQYDTPSPLNDDDRDEISALASLRYTRSISSVLTAGVSAAYQFGHLVFLKSLRSALNNQNTVIRLSPFVRIAGKSLIMQPQLEVLANYTIYDFEGQGASVRSYSFRQISYRDSIKIFLTQHIRTETQLLLRYFERGTLLPASFSEIPQTNNLEYLIKFLAFTTIGSTARDAVTTPWMQGVGQNIWDVGFGVRLYTLQQHTLQTVEGLPSLINSVHFWAPETSIRYRTAGGSTFSLSGWYEFQTVNVTGYRELPNVLLQAKVNL
ncbi:MAG: hypothetical protein HQ472_05115 [Ignavibacteria bacterium]|nr:hypothetical protein [Ignavibacteria bacterium]